MSYGTTDTLDRTKIPSTKDLDILKVTQAFYRLANKMEGTSPRPNRFLAAKLSVEQVKTEMSDFVNKQSKYLRYTAAIYLGRAFEQYVKENPHFSNFDQLKLAIDTLASNHQPGYLKDAEAKEKNLSYANRRLL